jgi:hypothetical protein
MPSRSLSPAFKTASDGQRTRCQASREEPGLTRRGSSGAGLPGPVVSPTLIRQERCESGRVYCRLEGLASFYLPFGKRLRDPC